MLGRETTQNYTSMSMSVLHLQPHLKHRCSSNPSNEDGKHRRYPTVYSRSTTTLFTPSICSENVAAGSVCRQACSTGYDGAHVHRGGAEYAGVIAIRKAVRRRGVGDWVHRGHGARRGGVDGRGDAGDFLHRCSGGRVDEA